MEATRVLRLLLFFCFNPPSFTLRKIKRHDCCTSLFLLSLLTLHILIRSAFEQPCSYWPSAFYLEVLHNMGPVINHHEFLRMKQETSVNRERGWKGAAAAATLSPSSLMSSPVQQANVHPLPPPFQLLPISSPYPQRVTIVRTKSDLNLILHTQTTASTLVSPTQCLTSSQLTWTNVLLVLPL